MVEKNMLHTVLNILNNPSVPLFIHYELCLGAVAWKLQSLYNIEGCRLHKCCVLNTVLRQLKSDQESKGGCLNNEIDVLGYLMLGTLYKNIASNGN